MIIRPALRTDLHRLTEIYNHYVVSSHATFDVSPFTEASREAWFSQFDGARYQCWTAESETGPVGYACSTPFKEKAAYQTSVEVSVYVASSAVGGGIGPTLYETLLPALEAEDLHRAYAGIAQPNEPSMKMHQAFDFQVVSRLTEVGRKFDRYWDVIWMERALSG